MGFIRFMEGNDGSQECVAEISDRAGQKINLKGTNENDEARSVILWDVREGARITVYDSPKGNTSDDWCEIDVLRHVDRYTVRSFEQNYEDDAVRVAYHRSNGLDGKVSLITVA